ncbi:MAG: TPM domain-containing protein [Vicinamibacterales bacterium]
MPTTSRAWLYRLAWVLLLAAMLWPVPATGGGLAPGGALVLAYWIGVRTLSGSATAATSLQTALFLLATFSNTIFLFTPVIRDAPRVTRACAAFLIGALVVDLAVAVMLPDFAHMAPYWIWVASIAAMTIAFVALPGTPRSAARTVKRRAPGRVGLGATSAVNGSVPGMVWGGLLVIVCWTLVPYTAPEAADPGGVASESSAPMALSTYVTDPAHVLTDGEEQELVAQLTELDEMTSTQLAVAIYPDTPASVEAFTIRVAEASRLGSSGVDNGAVLFVFPAARVARLEVGYGLEPILNDAKVGRLLETTFAPAWGRGDRAAALTATTDALTAIVREAQTDGRRTTRVAIARRRFAVGFAKVRKGALPALVAVPPGQRLVLTVFIALLGTGFLSGIQGLVGITRLIVRRVAGRRAGAPVDGVDLESIWDSLKLMGLSVGMILAAAGAVVVAGGGRFGGGGAFGRW